MGDIYADAKELLQSRTKEEHGTQVDKHGGFDSLGVVWAALLYEHTQDPQYLAPLPGELVCWMLSALKLLRAARRDRVSRDDLLDAINYVVLGEECRKETDRVERSKEES